MREAPIKTSAFAQGLRNTSATAKEKVGTIRILDNGTKWRYSKAGAALSAGKVTVAAAVPAAHITAALASYNTTYTQVTLTITAGTAIAENKFTGGVMQVESGTGAGKSFRIGANTAVTSAGTSITLDLEDPAVGLDATSKLALIHSPWYGVTHTTTEESLATGVPLVDVADGYFCWLQTGGPACTLVNGTPAVGTMLTLSGTSGALQAMNATLDIDMPIVAVSWGTAGVSGEYKPVFMKID